MTAIDIVKGGLREGQPNVLLPHSCWQMLGLAREGLSTHHTTCSLGPRERGFSCSEAQRSTVLSVFPQAWSKGIILKPGNLDACLRTVLFTLQLSLFNLGNKAKAVTSRNNARRPLGASLLLWASGSHC